MVNNFEWCAVKVSRNFRRAQSSVHFGTESLFSTRPPPALQRYTVIIETFRVGLHLVCATRAAARGAFGGAAVVVVVVVVVAVGAYSNY